MKNNSYTPQNLLPKRFDFLLGVHQSFRWIKLAGLVTLIITVLTVFASLGISILTSIENQGLKEIQVAKAKYDIAVQELNKNKEALVANEDRLKYVNSLQTDYTTFHDLLNYLDANKPKEVTILSMEDASLVPPPDMTADIISHASVSDLLNPNKKTVSTSDTPETSTGNNGNTSSSDMQVITTDDSSNPNVTMTQQEANQVSTDGTAPADGAAAPTEEAYDPELQRYKSTLQYTRDISTSSIVLRGYANNVAFVSSYITMISKAPNVKGFTIEGIESRNTSLPGTDIVLFELKISLKAVAE